MFLNNEQEMQLKEKAMEMALELSRQHVMNGEVPMRSSEIAVAAKKFFKFLKDPIF